MKYYIDYLNLYLFFFIIFSMIIPLTFFKYGQGFNLNSNYVAFITTEGIIKYDPETQEETKIIEFLSMNEGEKFISFAQFPSEDNGYFFCRIKQFIYIFSENFELLGNLTDNDIAQAFVELVPYKSKNGQLNIISVFANGALSLELKSFKLNYPNYSRDILEFQNVNIQKTFRHDSHNNDLVLNKRVSCELAYSSEYSQELLTCFLMNDQSMFLAINFNPENISPLSFSKNTFKTTGNNNIVSAVSTDKKRCIACYIDFSTNFYCSYYDVESNELSEPVILMTKCMQLEYGSDIVYISERNEYIGYCVLKISTKNIIKFDEKLDVKENEDKSKYYISFSTQSGDCYNVHSMSVLFIKTKQDYYIARTCDINNVPKLDLINISGENIVKNEIPQYSESNKYESTSILNTKSTNLTPKSTLISNSKIKSTILTPKSTFISNSKIKSTILTPKSTFISNFQIKSSTLDPKSTIVSNIPMKTTIPASESTLSSYIQKKSTTLSPKSTLVSNPQIKSTIHSPKSTFVSNIKSTISFFSTKILPFSLLSQIQSSSFPLTKKSNPLSTYISSSIISKPSSTIITAQNIKSTNAKFTTLLVPNTPSSSIKNSILSSSLSPKVISTSTIKSTSIPKISLLDSFISNSHIQYQSTLNTTYKNKLEFHMENDVMKATINLNKEELDDHLDDIIDQVDIGKRYEINGDDYNITITSVDDIDDFKTTYADLSICEQILRKVKNISDDTILTMLQIEIDKLNSQSLTNQVEYVIYDEDKNQLDLSCCKNTPIKVTYEIKERAVLNKTMIEYYSDMDIDVFNIKDSFFNDICYPFSQGHSDLILKDRVLDIYQNYSLCDNECEYDKINIENMTVVCSCKVKTELNTKALEPKFSRMIEDTFENSNIGVIKCYKLVFDFKNKNQNIGFLLFLFFFIANLICIILYFFTGIGSIKLFLYKEMEKNNYLLRTSNPKKKKFNEKISKSAILNSTINNNSSIALKNKNLDLKKVKKIKNKLKKKNSIIIFNYKSSNKYYNIKNNINYSSKDKVNSKIKHKINSKTKVKKSCLPGYYSIIWLNANNSSKKKPPESKYILDNYSYEDAIKYENRSFWRIYYICILSIDNIINTFIFRDPFENQYIRLSLFIFQIACDFALNSLFYLNINISEKYHYEGDNLYLFILVNNMVISIFSTLVYYLLGQFLYFLTNSTDSIEKIFKKEEILLRKNKNYKVSKDQKKIIFKSVLEQFKKLKIKLIIYIIIEFLLMLFFFYFVTAFCEVYKSTQKSWVFDSALSFILSIPLELAISLFISSLYLASVKLQIKFIYKIIIFVYKYA